MRKSSKEPVDQHLNEQCHNELFQDPSSKMKNPMMTNAQLKCAMMNNFKMIGSKMTDPKKR